MEMVKNASPQSDRTASPFSAGRGIMGTGTAQRGDHLEPQHGQHMVF